MQRNNYSIANSRILISILLIGLLGFCSCNANKQAGPEKAESKRITILGLGDSITEGGKTFHSYLFPLWKRLFTAGYKFDFIGPRSSNSRIGKIKHCGFSGENAEFLKKQIDSIYREYPADIVLLHSGHNHFNTENPVNGIIHAQKSIIEKILTINPDAKILVAKVVESGKLPKYSYIPELNQQIEKMLADLKNPNVTLVDQSKKFNWGKHSIADKVHPNPEGAEIMADAWFERLKQVLPEPENSFHPEIVPYKTTEQGNLDLHIFKPEKSNNQGKYPVIVYFFGGGWSLGTPLQFYRECDYYASKGFVAIAADYRIKYLNHTTPFESVEDAKDAVRWIRANAEELNIDPDKIVAAGSSAGGHLAAAIGTLNETHKGALSNYKPNLMLLYYPVIDNSEEGYGPEIIKSRYLEISPLHNIDTATPPALFVLGTQDPLIPVKTAREFRAKMEENGVECELHLIEGAGHPIFYYAKDLTDEFYTIRKLTDQFLLKHGYLNNEN
ncbi:alpha/beta hydrolase fold domain-containing protein [Maribellus sp. YY47]|uniref:alpha/beta hydrolase fold domain-containing protein n=1 Tax=Maribellus sp. YY47 TaxID=2929486 RepID=UPI002000C376|nr:alpha/beta hydrolase fold domain-containing protein [Maribellus sp. YY47]MCK3683910.1 alpha/beta hydrolase fold domain-containing protein [Maribellus sp. YY47]